MICRFFFSAASRFMASTSGASVRNHGLIRSRKDPRDDDSTRTATSVLSNTKGQLHGREGALHVVEADQPRSFCLSLT